MTTISTQRNRVITEEPEPDDVMVEVILFGEGDTPGAICARKLRHLPITHYRECLDWAVGIADHMTHPLYVVPLNHNDIFRTKRWEPYRAFIASMDDQERGEMDAIVVATCLEVMRDCSDPNVRADCYDMLAKLGVIHP